ncbi:uncharacterized protein [Nicotiana sylvestris]|uniref:uncharacterized protein n=1 Tax=Nicotiana sylvestris TaxID=4096 RepID=UPI00388CE5E8
MTLKEIHARGFALSKELARARENERDARLLLPDAEESEDEAGELVFELSATTEEWAILEECFPLNAYAQQLVGLSDGQRLPEDKDVNTLEQFEVEPKQFEEDNDDDVEEGAEDEEWTTTYEAFEDEGDDRSWAWLAKENEYRASIGNLENQVRELQFESGLQVAADEGEKKRLAKENEALRAQIQKMKIAAENPARSAKYEKLINNLRQKVNDYNFDLNKAESELAMARKQLAKNADERAHLVKQLKEKYDNEVAGLKKRVITTENKTMRQAKNFKDEREQCYTTMAWLERDLQQLQDHNWVAEQTLEARTEQIGRLLQEKNVLDVVVSYNMLLGRPWIHVARAVPSTLHQMVKFEWDRREIVVHGEDNLYVPSDAIVPFIEFEDEKGPWVY